MTRMLNMRNAAILMLSLLIGGAAVRAEPTADIDQRELPIRTERAFPELSFTRPIVLTHSGDETNRIFVASQLGDIQVFPNDRRAKRSKVFLDIRKRVTYKDRQNEEGFLGLAFHPQYKANGQFFVYYTTSEVPHTSVISRFSVSADDPDRADPDSEQELLRVKQPFWNHNGGNLAFGPDGYLYIGLGDGGSARDPHGNGQNRSTLLGSILRIDVDRKDPAKPYAIPPDNPFAGHENARPEIWAYGFRNIWGMAFDRDTGLLWAADVGQDDWEEVDIVRRGGNYGWNLREAMHKFGDAGSEPRDDLVEPIWEYHHSEGKSITGGRVYCGQRVPELRGAYIYADYVAGKIWALRYDLQQQRVTANHALQHEKKPIISFGEDETGELYLTDVFGNVLMLSKATP